MRHGLLPKASEESLHNMLAIAHANDWREVKLDLRDELQIRQEEHRQ